ncbi:MAG TPA: TetR family transcriptional regulator [Acidimicrobiales bacterium]|nr:TetR family transcriptional regulator [Acidimicrobiales bacterium]
MTAARRPGERAGLTRAAVLAAARDLLAESGLGSLTMRALARRLDVAPNALYSHVPAKAALVDDLLDEVLAEVDDSGDLYELLVSTYEVLLAHAELVPLYLARQGARGPHAARLGDTMLRLLADQGVRGERALDARRVLIVFTIGFAAFATHPPLEPGADVPLSVGALFDNFTRGLRWLLAGIGS